VPRQSAKRRAPGTGQIIARRGQYTAIISTSTLGRVDRRKTIRRSFSNRRAAEAWLDGLLRASRDGTLSLLPDRRTVGAFLTSWLNARPDLRPTTKALYDGLVTKWVMPFLGSRLLGDLKPSDIRTYYSKIADDGATPRVRRAVHVLLYAAFRVAAADGEIAASPMTNIKSPRYSPSERVILNEAHIGALLDALRGHELEAFFVVMIAGGLRLGEATGLQWRDVDWERGRITIARSLAFVNKKPVYHLPKTAAGKRTIDLPEAAMAVLAEHRERGRAVEPENLIFTARGGGPLDRNNLRGRVWKKLKQQANLPSGARLHDLRHAHASLLIARGADIKTTQARMGHASAAITMDVYAHAGVLPGLAKSAAASLEPLLKRLGGASTADPATDAVGDAQAGTERGT
jgi:integrase